MRSEKNFGKGAKPSSKFTMRPIDPKHCYCIKSLCFYWPLLVNNVTYLVVLSSSCERMIFAGLMQSGPSQVLHVLNRFFLYLKINNFLVFFIIIIILHLPTFPYSNWFIGVWRVRQCNFVIVGRVSGPSPPGMTTPNKQSAPLPPSPTLKEAKRARKNSGGGRYEVGDYGKGGTGLSKFLPVESGGGVSLGIINTGGGGMTPAKFMAVSSASADIAEQSNSLQSMSGAFSQDSNLSSGISFSTAVSLVSLLCLF